MHKFELMRCIFTLIVSEYSALARVCHHKANGRPDLPSFVENQPFLTLPKTIELKKFHGAFLLIVLSLWSCTDSNGGIEGKRICSQAGGLSAARNAGVETAGGAVSRTS